MYQTLLTTITLPLPTLLSSHFGITIHVARMVRIITAAPGTIRQETILVFSLQLVFAGHF